MQPNLASILTGLARTQRRERMWGRRCVDAWVLATATAALVVFFAVVAVVTVIDSKRPGCRPSGHHVETDG